MHIGIDERKICIILWNAILFEYIKKSYGIILEPDRNGEEP